MSILKKLRPDGILDPKGKYLNPFNQQPYSKCYYKASKNWSEYVTWTDHEKIFNMIHNNSVLLLIAATGAGKTVIIPKLLLHYFGYKDKIICTTPRQATTSAAAEYASYCMDVPILQINAADCKVVEDPNILGKDKRILSGNLFIGYQHGDSGTKFTDNSTKLLFITDGLLKNRILNDPDLSEYMGIIIDEAHERSVNIDVVIALILDICKRRPEFKVIIMSATIEQSLFTDYFDRIGLKGKYAVYIPKVNATQFTIDYKPETVPINRSKLVDVIYAKIESIILNPALPTGDILAFVTSESETQKVEKLMKLNMAKFPLNRRPYTIPFTAKINQSNKDIATKKEALKKIPPDPQVAPQGYAMKVIVATNVVESSVTFEDPLVYVIESGLAFEKKFDAANYCYETGKFYVSQASVKQRCGRTGRTNAGYCFQLYTEHQITKEFLKFTPPKIVLEDITSELLGLSCLPMHNNIKSALSFIENKMIEPVRNYSDAIRVARNNLVNMGLATESGDISPLGRICNEFGKYDIKTAKMIIGGYYLGCMYVSIVLGALLFVVRSLDDLFYKPPGMESFKADALVKKILMSFKHESGDHLTLLRIFTGWQNSPNRKLFCQQHSLQESILNTVQISIDDLLKIVKKNAPNIRSLWLFGVPQEILTIQDAVMRGGSTGHSSRYTDDDDDDDLRIDEMEAAVTEHFDNPATNPNITNSDHQFEELETVMSGGSIPFPYFGEATLDSDSVDRDRARKLDSDSVAWARKLDSAHKLTKKVQFGSGPPIGKNPARSVTPKGVKGVKGVNAENKKHDVNPAIKLAKWENVMNVITLKDLKPMHLNVPVELYRKVLGALYYGFSTNIASFSGVSKNYNVKYSGLKGSIAKSILDIENITPNLIIYQEFVVSKEPPRPSSQLSIVSILDLPTIKIFLNIDDIKKKIKN